MYGIGGKSSDWSPSRGRGSKSRGRGFHSEEGPDTKYRKTYNASDEVVEQVRELFMKKFQFSRADHQWKVPDPLQIFHDPRYTLHKLQDIKESLNNVKSKLNEKELTSWQRHTKFTNRSATIIPSIRTQYSPDLCTQGWTKLHEILTSYNIVPDSMIRLNSVHLCEIPGGFITSLNHYLKTHRVDVIWQWRAMSLNPYYEGNHLLSLIDQDRFMIETIGQWYFGKDNSGDIMNWSNVAGLVERVKNELKEIHLVTADGSIDCSNTPGEQEDMVSQLLYCETIAGLMILREEGIFILKTFTTLECQSVCLMYLLATLFREVNVYKPVCSKAGNSEQYVICIGYKGKSLLTDNYISRLKLGFSNTYFSKALFPMTCIPETFLTQLVNCSSKFTNYQINAIEENLKLYVCMKYSEKKFILDVKDHCCSEFLKKCKLKKLPREKSILDIHIDGINGLHYVSPPILSVEESVMDRRSTGSLVSRLESLQRPWADVIDSTKLYNNKGYRSGLSEGARLVVHYLGYTGGGSGQEVGGINEGVVIPTASVDVEPEDVTWLKCRYGNKDIDKGYLNTLDGKRVDKVTNSKFIRSDTLRKLVDVIEKAEVIQSSNVTEYGHIVSCCIPCHALLTNDSYFLNTEGLNLAAIDILTGIISQVNNDRPLSFVDLWGAPSNYGQYLYWTKSNYTIQGWGVVRSECPLLRPSPSLARLVQWDNFQILGSVQGLNITSNDTVNSIVSAVHDVVSDGVQLVFGDVSSLPFGSHPPGSEEYHTKQQLLSQCVCALKLLAVNGSFVCRVYSVLTRFSAGLIYILHQVFKEVALVKPVTSSPVSCEQFLVCKGYNGCPSIVCDLLMEINDHISDLKSKPYTGSGGLLTAAPLTDVLEIVPVKLLLDDDNFYQYLCHHNERIAKLQTHTLFKLDKYYLGFESLPQDDVQDKLRKGMLELLKLPEEQI